LQGCWEEMEGQPVVRQVQLGLAAAGRPRWVAAAMNEVMGPIQPAPDVAGTARVAVTPHGAAPPLPLESLVAITLDFWAEPLAPRWARSGATLAAGLVLRPLQQSWKTLVLHWLLSLHSLPTSLLPLPIVPLTLRLPRQTAVAAAAAAAAPAAAAPAAAAAAAVHLLACSISHPCEQEPPQVPHRAVLAPRAQAPRQLALVVAAERSTCLSMLLQSLCYRRCSAQCHPNWQNTLSASSPHHHLLLLSVMLHRLAPK